MDRFDDLFRNQALLSSAVGVKQDKAAASPTVTSAPIKHAASPSSSMTSVPIKHAPSPTMPSKPSDKRYRCVTCGQSFSRAEHLNRHQTRHTGAKPFSCVFCARKFSRKDRLQSHYGHCQRRGDREPPNSIPKGRRPHACVTCISSKIRCDGSIPCAQCKKKKMQCRQKPSDRQSSTDKLLEDRVSIKALLNGGTDTFTETFNLPPSDDRIRSLQFHQRNEDSDETNDASILPAGSRSPPPIDYSMFDSALEVNDEYLDFWTGPFAFIPSPSYSDLQVELYDPTLVSSDALHRPTPSESTQTLPDQAQYVSALNMAIYNKLWCLALDAKPRQELNACLNFLLTGDKISKFISLYFRNWHLNCPILHRPSFDPAKVPLSLLVSVMFIGAMYSKDQTERLAAKRLLDVAELVVFDSDIFSFDAEVSRSLQGSDRGSFSSTARLESDWELFQELQAGYLMVVAQYWAGPLVSKRRAMESRFGDVIKIARKFNLHRARHQPSDRISETAWLQKESRIRTTSVIALLDCAMKIYSNYPCRLTLAELDVDLPCKEAIFNSRHPFMQDDSIFAPRLTIPRAFALLFDKGSTSSPGLAIDPTLSSAITTPTTATATATPIPTSTSTSTPTMSLELAGNCDLTVFDLFILIHYLYTYVHSYILTLSLNLPTTFMHPEHPRPNANGGGTAAGSGSADGRGSGTAARSGDGDGRGAGAAATDGNRSTPNPLSTGPMHQDIKMALDRWHNLWQAVCAQYSDESMKTAGMFRNGVHFWLVAQSLVTRDEAVDFVTGMEVNCDDALTKLRVLFQNDCENENENEIETGNGNGNDGENE